MPSSHHSESDASFVGDMHLTIDGELGCGGIAEFDFAPKQQVLVFLPPLEFAALALLARAKVRGAELQWPASTYVTAERMAQQFYMHGLDQPHQPGVVVKAVYRLRKRLDQVAWPSDGQAGFRFGHELIHNQRHLGYRLDIAARQITVSLRESKQGRK